MMPDLYLEMERKLADQFWQGLGKSIDRENISEVMDDFIAQMRSALPETSPTATAIDQKDPWVVIAKNAFRENLQSFAEFLYIADRLKLHRDEASKRK